MKVKCTLDIFMDGCDVNTDDIIDFLSSCGEDVNVDVKVLEIDELED